MKIKVSSKRLDIVRIEDEESSSSSSMSMYCIKYNEKDSEVSSRRSPNLIENQVPEQPKEVHSSPTTDNTQSARHSQAQQEEE